MRRSCGVESRDRRGIALRRGPASQFAAIVRLIARTVAGCSRPVPPMNTPIASLRRTTLGRSVGLAAGFAVALALNALAAAPQPVADELLALPVTVSFEKVTDDDGPYVMTVTNTSAAALTVKVVVHQSVQSHNRPKDVDHPVVTIDAGKSAAYKQLAAHDKAKISAEGFATVEIVVPGSQ